MRHLDPAVTRARWLLLGLFGLAGITFSSWLARIPTVRDLLDLSTSELGLMLLVGSVGALLTVTVSGIVVQRFGSRVGIVASTVVLAVALVLMGIGPSIGSVALLGVGIFLNGVAVALGNVPLNVESARIERAMGRTVIPQFHAAFSIGAVAGSALGATASHLGVSVVAQFTAVAALAVVWRLASLRGVVLADAPGDRPRTSVPPAVGAATVGRRRRIASSLDSWREPRTLLIGVVIMAAALSEGSANDWLSLAVVDGFDQTEAVGGAMLGVFVGAMTLVRLLGTRLIDRFGRVPVLRASGVVSIAGLLLFGFAPSLVLAGVGIVLWGFGAALAVPVGIAAASDDPMRAAGRVAVVSSFASVASIAAPPLLGIAAASTGARHALVFIAVAMLASVLLAARVAPERAPTADVPARTTDEPTALVADADPDPYGAIAARHADHVTATHRPVRRRRLVRAP
ncbi:MFS transporter [Cellulomonas sp. ICMP 17802]|uniref:MFS transporter n=1 Tax=Cellulomonas sp. ICMP 17802 TaxID=3239199 RepID=UPI00351BAF91